MGQNSLIFASSLVSQDEPGLWVRLLTGWHDAPWVQNVAPWLVTFTGLQMLLGLAGLMALMFIWWERKTAGRIQSRVGPNRVGWFGLLQSIADGIKLISKEDLYPAGSDKLLFKAAPYVAFVPVFVAFIAMPFGPELTFEPLLHSGVLLVLAVLSVEVVGVVMAGWASNNKWSIYGAMREACQMISYEVPLGLAILVGVMTAGTLSLLQVGHMQSGGLHTWLIFASPMTAMAFVFYFIASLASNKRAPFDLPESESELVAGYHTEYSGLRFSFFYFAEYVGMFIVAAVQVGLFLGSWNDPFGLIGKYHTQFSAEKNDIALALLNVIAAGIFVIKCLVLVFIQIWVRWTLPRPRIDQVLYMCFKVMLPGGLVILGAQALWMLLLPVRPGVPWVDHHPWDLAVWWQSGFAFDLLTRLLLSTLALLGTAIVAGWVVFSFVSGMTDRRRLSKPSDIMVVPPMAP